jgi:hypothetical protein
MQGTAAFVLSAVKDDWRNYIDNISTGDYFLGRRQCWRF